MSDVFTIKELESFPPGARPMDEDFENMGTSLGTNVMVLHKTFPSQEMTWMVLVHIPTGKRIKIMFPEEEERRLSPEEMCDMLAGHDTGVGTGEDTMPTSVIGEEELKASLNALKDLGVMSAVRELGHLLPEADSDDAR